MPLRCRTCAHALANPADERVDRLRPSVVDDLALEIDDLVHAKAMRIRAIRVAATAGRGRIDRWLQQVALHYSLCYSRRRAMAI